MIYEAARQRALHFPGPERATTVFSALTGAYNLHRFNCYAAATPRYGICFHCKKEQGSTLIPICTDLTCILSFNKKTHFQRYDYVKFYFSDALWLSMLNLKEITHEHIIP